MFSASSTNQFLAWVKNAGLRWNFDDSDHVLAKRLMENRLDLWRKFAEAFNVGFDPNTDKFYNLNDTKEFKAWADLVFAGDIPHADLDEN